MINTNMSLKYTIYAAVTFPNEADKNLQYIIVTKYLSPTEFTFKSNSELFFKFRQHRLNNFSLAVIDHENNDEIIPPRIMGNEDLKFYNYNYKTFFTPEHMDNYFGVSKEKNSNMILIFQSVSWQEVLLRFRMLGIIVSGGEKRRRGDLSQIQFILSSFLLCLENNGNQTLSKIKDSFHFEGDLRGKGDKDNRAYVNFKDKEFVSKIIDRVPKLQKELVNNHPIFSLRKSSTVNSRNITSTPFLNGQKKEFHSCCIIQKKEFHSCCIIQNKNIITTKSLEVSKDTFKYLDTVKELLNNVNLTPFEIQKKIESEWLDIISNKLTDSKYLTDHNKQVLHGKILEAEETLNINFDDKYFVKKFPFLINNKKYNLQYLILAFSFIMTYYHKLKYTALSIEIGRAILHHLFNLNKKLKLIDKDMKLADYIENLNLKKDAMPALAGFFINVFMSVPHDLVELITDDEGGWSKDRQPPYIVLIKEKYLHKIRESVIITPFTLPMICKPNEWSDTKFGGYLSNEHICNTVITGSNYHEHSVENKEMLYKSINYLNSIKFSINNKLLRYLLNEGSYLFDNYTKNTLQRDITLKVAETFANCNKPFYLSVHADWRGRLYTQSFFIDYQGSDLSLSLIQIWECDDKPLTEEGKEYLYIYGANNHNQGSISKESYENRVKWVETNYNKIISLDKDLINSAENPFVFAAFCLNMRDLDKNPNTVITTPVFLDATCNGIQHLAGLLKDLELGTEVNLVSTSETQTETFGGKPSLNKDKPKDLYSKLIDPINKAINKVGMENIEYYSLRFVKFTRKILKHSLMTKVYNVSIYGISQQLQSKLASIKNLEKNGFVSDKIKIILSKETPPSEIELLISKYIEKNLKVSKHGTFLAPGVDSSVVFI